jgi:hypothetical protein
VPAAALRTDAETSALGSLEKTCLTMFIFGVIAWALNHWGPFVR